MADMDREVGIMVTVLGDSPSFLMNALGFNLLELFGGADAPGILGIVLFCVLAYLALSYRLDRGALTLLGVIGTGLMIATGALPSSVWFVMVILVGVVGGYGILNALRQGDA